jgi:hypothetical protein
MRKPIATVVTAAALAASLLLAGCGSDADGAAPTTTKAKATTTAAPTTAAPTTTTGGGTAGEGTTAAGASTDPADIAFCQDLQAAFGDYQPHIDDIFTQYGDNPTLAQWAAFLPDEVAKMDAMIERVSAVEPSPNLADDLQAAVAAFQTMSKNFHDTIAAAEAGDETEFKRLEDENQNTNTPALQAATSTIGTACGFPQG